MRYYYSVSSLFAYNWNIGTCTKSIKQNLNSDASEDALRDLSLIDMWRRISMIILSEKR